MTAEPVALQERLKEFGQDHVLRWLPELADNDRQLLLGQLKALDLAELRQLWTDRDVASHVPSAERIAPPPVIRLHEAKPSVRKLGEDALRRGEVAVLLVAGGQGSRLGFEHPKGMFPIGPVSRKTLFQIHAEKVLALRRKYGRPIPFLMMTSQATHAPTEAFFAEHQHFGLPAEEVGFFQQGTMPALDLATGKLLMEERGRLFTSPNGHGGTLTALADSGWLDRLQRQGIRHLFYFQVDNPLIKVADPEFLGDHLAARAEVSLKIVAKEGPTDKMGNLVLVDGRCTIIEYSDLPESLARQTDANGQLSIWAGSPAIHFFDVDFLTRLTQGGTHIPFHLARKKVPYLDDRGMLVKPSHENALKFERFIFDVLPLAERWAVVEASRPEEFQPLKNATGPDSPQTVEQAISDLARVWLEGAGVHVPKADGHAAVPLEISPLFALDAAELAAKVDRRMRIEGPTYLGHGQE